MPDPHSSADASEFPEPFRSAVAAVSAARLRPEMSYERMGAPQRIAPYAVALSGDVTVGDEEIATGRLVLLHDPDGNPAWHGTTRCVLYARSEIEGDLASDPAFAAAAWTWLADALESRNADYTAESGSVTRVTSESFGGMADEDVTSHVEIRASWTPLGLEQLPARLTAHVEAWAELMGLAAGLQPLPDGVASLPNRRSRRA